MLAQARGYDTLVETDIATWHPAERPALIFSNAALHWLGDHTHLMPRLAGYLAPGGVLAVQMPDNMNEPSHVMMREVAQLPQFQERLAHVLDARGELPKPGAYYDALRPLCQRLDIWHTIYNHVLDDAGAIVEWVKGTGLRPFLDPLDVPERKEFLEAYKTRIAASYPPQADGKVLLCFPRLFLLVVK